MWKKYFGYFLILFILLVTISINLPRIGINKKVGPYKINYIGGYEISFGNFNRDLVLKKGLDIAGGIRVILKPDLSEIKEDNKKDALESLKSVIETRVNRFGVNEPNISIVRFANEYEVYVEIPGVTDVNRAVNLIGQTAQLSFRIEKDGGQTNPDDPETTIPDFEVTSLTSEDVQQAVPDFYADASGQREPSVKLVFNSSGAEKFGDITSQNIGKRLGIFLDDYPLIAPSIQSPIYTGEAFITGGFTVEQAKDIAIQINSGALPVPVEIVGQSQVGPSVGAKSINQSVYGGILGLILVITFMILNYKRLGLLSSISLIIYGLITLTVYKVIPITLTLPGVAGFILSIGMAVDSNILIFERVKEEMRRGATYSNALLDGFDKAWGSIKDANLASLIIAFILFNPLEWGFLLISGPVRGFAVTLGIGIMISLFTGVYVTRNLIKLFFKVN